MPPHGSPLSMISETGGKVVLSGWPSEVLARGTVSSRSMCTGSRTVTRKATMTSDDAKVSSMVVWAANSGDSMS